MKDTSGPPSAGDDDPSPTLRDREAEHGHDDELVDEASDESFPASDPPAFTHSHAGPPTPADPAPDPSAATGG